MLDHSARRLLINQYSIICSTTLNKHVNQLTRYDVKNLVRSAALLVWILFRSNVTVRGEALLIYSAEPEKTSKEVEFFRENVGGGRGVLISNGAFLKKVLTPPWLKKFRTLRCAFWFSVRLLNSKGAEMGWVEKLGIFIRMLITALYYVGARENLAKGAWCLINIFPNSYVGQILNYSCRAEKVMQISYLWGSSYPSSEAAHSEHNILLIKHRYEIEQFPKKFRDAARCQIVGDKSLFDIGYTREVASNLLVVDACETTRYSSHEINAFYKCLFEACNAAGVSGRVVMRRHPSVDANKYQNTIKKLGRLYGINVVMDINTNPVDSLMQARAIVVVNSTLVDLIAYNRIPCVNLSPWFVKQYCDGITDGEKYAVKAGAYNIDDIDKLPGSLREMWGVSISKC